MRTGFFLLLLACGSAPPATPPAPAPVPVQVETLAPASLDRTLQGVGTVAALQSVEIRPEVAGLVSAVLFTDGAQVPQDTPLVRLRDQDARAAVQEATARATLAELDLKRVAALAERGDAATAELDAAQAQRALTQAALARANEGLRRTLIRAPFAGALGKHEVSAGQLVDPSKRITTLEALDPIAVDLALPESALALVRPGLAATVTALGDPQAATVSYVSPRVREDTRTVDVRVTLPNPERRLLPGQSATVLVVSETVPAAIEVPTQAVLQTAQGTAVYVYGDDNTAQLRPVQLGQRGEARVEVRSGLAAGDKVIVQGLARLRPGAPVRLDEPAPPAAGKTP